MHPVLFKIFSFPIHSYGLMLALSFLLGIWFSGWLAKKRGLNPEVIADMGFWLILSAIVGARLYYVILHFEEFRGDLLSIINPFQGETIGIGGLVMLGGYIGAVIAAILFFKIKKLPFLPYADVVSPSVGFGIMLTRIGCFLNGCCYGGVSEGLLAVKFPLECPAGAYQHHIHAASLYPSQLFESIGGLIIALIVLAVARKKIFIGFQFYLTGLLYSVLRFFVDYSRFYDTSERLFGTSLSHNQGICIVMFILFGGLILKNFLFKEEIAATTAPNTATDQSVSTTADKA
jgi:phosphatidylglycerol:prolipoprotein diacylglycerol transferase